MPNTEVVKLADRGEIDLAMSRNMEQFMAALGGNAMKVERWKTLLLMELYRHPDLAKCDPGSVVASALEAAQFGLEFGPRQHSYLVPYKTECTFQPSYRGLIHLAKKSGEAQSIYAELICTADDFDYELGTHKRIDHKPPKNSDRGAMIGVYAVIKFVVPHADPDFEIMSRAQVDHIRAKSQSKTGPWFTDYEEMAKKAAIKRLCKRLDISEGLARVIDLDDSQYKVVEEKINMPQEKAK